MHRKVIINSDISKTYCNNYLLVIITLAIWILFKGLKMYNIKMQPLVNYKIQNSSPKNNSNRPTIRKFRAQDKIG